MIQELLKTPLYEWHQDHKAKMIPFGRWLMPVSYTSVIEEHHCVRNYCGLFDVSHMGEIFVDGKDAEAFLQYLTINNVKKLVPGDGQYTALLNEQAGFVDDLILYKLADRSFLLCVNASNTDKDFSWLCLHKDNYQIDIRNASDDYGQIAVQGPKSLDVVLHALPEKTRNLIGDLKYTKILSFDHSGQECYIARTGYTGEKGYEIYLPNAVTLKIWQKLLNYSEQVKPIGLGARDTLRTEACYLLYGNDMDDRTTPLEAGIGWAVCFDCDDFIGKAVLEKQTHSLKRKIFAFKMRDQAIPRHGMAIFKDNKEIGSVTTGSVLPTLGGAGGMALLSINQEDVKIGDLVDIDVRGKRKLAEIAKRPLYSAKVKD